MRRQIWMPPKIFQSRTQLCVEIITMDRNARLVQSLRWRFLEISANFWKFLEIVIALKSTQELPWVQSSGVR
jgi:hypothetical protein